MGRKKRSIPGIRSLGNGKYEARVRHGSRGNQKSLYFTGSFNECRAWQAEIKRRREARVSLYAPIEGLEWPKKGTSEEKIAACDGEQVTINKLVQDFRENPDLYAGSAKRTRTAIDRCFRILLEWSNANSITYVNEMQVAASSFYSWLRREYSQREWELQRIVKRMKQLFRFALSQQKVNPNYCHLKFNPFEDCKPPVPTLPEIRWFSWEEHKRLREHMTVAEMEPYGSADYRRGIWELLYYTGMRPGELCHLMWKNVREDHIMIARTNRMEAERLGVEEWNPKVRKRRQNQNRIELHEQARVWLAWFRSLHARGCFCIGLNREGAILRPLPVHVITEILNYIETSDCPATARELYGMLVSRGLLQPSPSNNPARAFAIRLAWSETRGKLFRQLTQKKYGFEKHFIGQPHELLRSGSEREQIPLRPKMKQAGPYVVGGNSPLSESNLNRWFDNLIEVTMAKHSGLNLIDTSPKTFRSTLGSHLLQKGVEIAKVARVLRHSDIRTTQKHYASLLNEDIRESLNLL